MIGNACSAVQYGVCYREPAIFDPAVFHSAGSSWVIIARPTQIDLACEGDVGWLIRLVGSSLSATDGYRVFVVVLAVINARWEPDGTLAGSEAGSAKA